MFSVTINVREHLKDRELKDIVVRFNTAEEKINYVHGEQRYTENQLKAYAAAWSQEQRDRAQIDLYKARKSYYELVTHKKNNKALPPLDAA